MTWRKGWLNPVTKGFWGAISFVLVPASVFSVLLGLFYGRDAAVLMFTAIAFVAIFLVPFAIYLTVSDWRYAKKEGYR